MNGDERLRQYTHNKRPPEVARFLRQFTTDDRLDVTNRLMTMGLKSYAAWSPTMRSELDRLLVRSKSEEEEEKELRAHAAADGPHPSQRLAAHDWYSRQGVVRTPRTRSEERSTENTATNTRGNSRQTVSSTLSHKQRLTPTASRPQQQQRSHSAVVSKVRVATSSAAAPAVRNSTPSLPTKSAHVKASRPRNNTPPTRVEPSRVVASGGLSPPVPAPRTAVPLPAARETSPLPRLDSSGSIQMVERGKHPRNDLEPITRTNACDVRHDIRMRRQGARAHYGRFDGPDFIFVGHDVETLRRKREAKHDSDAILVVQPSSAPPNLPAMVQHSIASESADEDDINTNTEKAVMSEPSPSGIVADASRSTSMREQSDGGEMENTHREEGEACVDRQNDEAKEVEGEDAHKVEGCQAGGEPTEETVENDQDTNTNPLLLPNVNTLVEQEALPAEGANGDADAKEGGKDASDAHAEELADVFVVKNQSSPFDKSSEPLCADEEVDEVPPVATRGDANPHAPLEENRHIAVEHRSTSTAPVLPPPTLNEQAVQVDPSPVDVNFAATMTEHEEDERVRAERWEIQTLRAVEEAVRVAVDDYSSALAHARAGRPSTAVQTYNATFASSCVQTEDDLVGVAIGSEIQKREEEEEKEEEGVEEKEEANSAREDEQHGALVTRSDPLTSSSTEAQAVTIIRKATSHRFTADFEDEEEETSDDEASEDRDSSRIAPRVNHYTVTTELEEVAGNVFAPPSSSGWHTMGKNLIDASTLVMRDEEGNASIIRLFGPDFVHALKEIILASRGARLTREELVARLPTRCEEAVAHPGFGNLYRSLLLMYHLGV